MAKKEKNKKTVPWQRSKRIIKNRTRAKKKKNKKTLRCPQR